VPRRTVRLRVKVIPRSRDTGFAGKMSDGTVKIRLKSPPVGGKANMELKRFLALKFGTRMEKVEVAVGAASRRKIVIVEDITRTPVELTEGPRTG